MIAALGIAAAYGALMWQFGWAGLVVGLIHLAVMFLGLPRR